VTLQDWLQFAEILNKLALPVGGSIGLFLAWRRVAAANRQAEAQIRQAEASTRQAELGNRKQASDLFSQAVGQLRDDKLEVRLWAIYSLRQVGHESPGDLDTIVSLLAAYIRDNPTRWRDDEEPPADVREILGILASSRSVSE